MAKHGGKPEDFCHVSGKRKYTSDKAAKKGLRKLTGDRIGTYRCPDCSFIHLRNQDRYGKRLAPQPPGERTMGKTRKKKKRKKKKRSVGGRYECRFCLGVGAFGTFEGKKICKDCVRHVRTQQGRAFLRHAESEAFRICVAEAEARRQ